LQVSLIFPFFASAVIKAQFPAVRSCFIRLGAAAFVSMSLAAWPQPAPVLAASSPATIPAFKDLDSIDARLQGCVTCHGRNGEGTGDGTFPRIAGKPAGYLLHQLAAFRDGTRKYPPMNYLLAYMPDSYLREIADHFANERPPFAPVPGKTVDDATRQRGQVLATAGDAHLGIPACIACHGAGLTGTQPGIPGLVGLRANYIVGQLTRWRVGDRHAIEPDCMKRVASRLTNTDMVAVAAWLSEQEPPKNPSPRIEPATRLPLACGSQAQGDQ
jgi:cytochrome c553